jgi:hypothetical protein
MAPEVGSMFGPVAVAGKLSPSAGVTVPGAPVTTCGGSEFGTVRSSYVYQEPPLNPAPSGAVDVMSSRTGPSGPVLPTGQEVTTVAWLELAALVPPALLLLAPPPPVLEELAVLLPVSVPVLVAPGVPVVLLKQAHADARPPKAANPSA